MFILLRSSITLIRRSENVQSCIHSLDSLLLDFADLQLTHSFSLSGKWISSRFVTNVLTSAVLVSIDNEKNIGQSSAEYVRNC